jgi:hypothetical protein
VRSCSATASALGGGSRAGWLAELRGRARDEVGAGSVRARLAACAAPVCGATDQRRLRASPAGERACTRITVGPAKRARAARAGSISIHSDVTLASKVRPPAAVTLAHAIASRRREERLDPVARPRALDGRSGARARLGSGCVVGGQGTRAPVELHSSEQRLPSSRSA